MRFSALLPLLVANACASTEGPTVPLAPVNWQQDVAAAADALMASRRVKSLSIAVVHGEQIWTKAYGEAEPGVPAVPDAFYEIGSITKVFTALLLADAIERGEVGPNATIGELGPELKLPTEIAAISLESLANHTSGLPRMPANFSPADGADPYADYDLDRLWVGLADAKLGPKRYAYSNLGMAVLGQLLARRVGKSYEALLRARVLAPLKLQALRLGPGEADAQGHDEAGIPRTDWRFDAFAPAGAIRASAPELLRFVEAQIEAEAGHSPVAAAMRRTQTRTAALPGPGAIGLGWHIDVAGRRWHNGQTLGAHGFAGIRPGAYGVVVLSNTATSDVDRLGRAMLDVLDGKEVALSFQRMVEVPDELLQRYVGEYAIQPNFSLTITARDGRLHVQGTGQPALPMRAIGDHTFELSVVEASGRFILPERGPAEVLVWNQGGQSARAKRVD